MSNNFFTQMRSTGDRALFYIAVLALYAAPALIGMFLGAPLVARELESGTLRLAWNQSVPRGRWLAVKLGFVGLLAMATAGVLSLLTTWWANPIYQAGHYVPDDAFAVNRFPPLLFGVNGIAPIGYAAFAFALGVTAGILIRRTVPAMAAVLAGFAFVQVAWPNWIRPHLTSPVRQVSASNFSAIDELIMDPHTKQITLVTGASKPGAWILSNQTIDQAGHVYTGPAPHVCLTGSPGACFATLGRLHLRQLLTYQPASRFWAFQWYETGIFLALAVALAGFCAWQISRRHIA